MVKRKTDAINYSFFVGLGKTVKNFAIFWGPAIIAFLTNVPQQYAGAAAFLLYMFKNWYEVTQGKVI